MCVLTKGVWFAATVIHRMECMCVLGGLSLAAILITRALRSMFKVKSVELA